MQEISLLNISRRRFLSRVGTATTLAAAPAIRVEGQSDSDDEISVAFMGLNGRGTDLVKEFLAQPGVLVSWLCDVDSRAIEKAGKLVAAKQRRAFKTEKDFRRILDDRRVNAVVIAAPDHWHTPAAIQALASGKHVYLEKPMSHNPRESELLAEAVRRSRRILQIGTQRRSNDWVIEAMNRVQKREFGPIYFARAWYTNRRGAIGYGQLAPVPEWLDFDLWQGPAPVQAFKDNVVHYNWHWFWNWGTGELGNNGIHYLDLLRWGLQVDCPLRVTSSGSRYFFEDDQETPDTQVVTYDYGKLMILWEHRSCHPHGMEEAPGGVAFHGQKGVLLLTDGGYRLTDLDGKELARVSGQVSTAPHVANFLECLRNPARKPNANVEDGLKNTLLCHAGNIAHRAQRTITLNAKTRQLVGEKDITHLWSREYRSGWEPTV